MDVMTPKQRHKAMSHNRGRTQPEKALASGLWHRGIRYFTHKGYQSITGKRLPGQPDMILPRKKIALFVDGCFWHGCPECRKHTGLKETFWTEKIATNKLRDQRVTAGLKKMGWVVYRIPEHDVRSNARVKATVDLLLPLLKSQPPKGKM